MERIVACPFFIDQAGRTISLNAIPKQIISVVPSQTKLFFDLGLSEKLKAQAIKAQIILVDGEMFSWYGSRLLYAPEYFASIRSLIPFPSPPREGRCYRIKPNFRFFHFFFRIQPSNYSIAHVYALPLIYIL